MPPQQTPSVSLELRVFVSSPSDVSEERNIVSAVADEINRLDGRRRGYHLSVRQWEKDTLPSPGDIQENVTRDLGPYEIFVGMMWRRFGTPTARAGSGTEEEFNLALEAWQQDNSRAVLFYFRTTPFLPTLDEYEQFGKVLAFRSRITRDMLFWEYVDAGDFQRKLRTHLAMAVNRYLDAHPELLPGNKGAAPSSDVTSDQLSESHILSVYLGNTWGDGSNPMIRSQLEVRLREDDFDVKLVGQKEFLASSPADPLVAVHFIGVPSTDAQRQEVSHGIAHARWQLMRSTEYPKPDDRFYQQLKSLDRTRAEFLPVLYKDATAIIADKIAAWQLEWHQQSMRATKLYLDIPPGDRNNKTVTEFLAWLEKYKIEHVMRNYDSSPTLRDFISTIHTSKAAVFVFASGSPSAVKSRIEKAWGVACTRPYDLDLWGVFLASPAESTVLRFDRVPEGRMKYMNNIAQWDEKTVNCVLEAMVGSTTS